MYIKKLNLLPNEQKTFVLQERAKNGAILLFLAVGIGIGGFEVYMNQLEEKVATLESEKADVDQVKQQTTSLQTEITEQEDLIKILQNKDFPIHDFLLTLSVQIPKDIWLYSVSSDDYQSATAGNGATDTGTGQPTNTTGQPTAPTTTGQTTAQNGQTTTNTQTQPTGQTTTTGQATNITGQATGTTPTTGQATGTTGTTPTTGQATGTTGATGTTTQQANPKAHKTLTIRGAGTSPTQIGQFVQLLNSKNYIEKATLSSVEEYLANGQVYQAFEIKVEGK